MSGDGFNDGQSSEDRVFTDIEHVTGTQFDDVIFVPNQQNSGRSPHGLLSGHGGNDQLLGTPFVDTLDGGAGQDTLTGGLGDDLLTGRENGMAGETVARDDMRCGGGIDTAVMDLQDVQSDCENRSIAAIDEGGILSSSRATRTSAAGGSSCAFTARAPRKPPATAASRLPAANGRLARGRTRSSAAAARASPSGQRPVGVRHGRPRWSAIHKAGRKRLWCC